MRCLKLVLFTIAICFVTNVLQAQTPTEVSITQYGGGTNVPPGFFNIGYRVTTLDGLPINDGPVAEVLVQLCNEEGTYCMDSCDGPLTGGNGSCYFDLNVAYGEYLLIVEYFPDNNSGTPIYVRSTITHLVAGDAFGGLSPV
jgi:hypothetical protein